MRRPAKCIAVEEIRFWANLASQMRVAFSRIAWKTGLQISGRGTDNFQHF